jgi:hypothetical protein
MFMTSIFNQFSLTNSGALLRNLHVLQPCIEHNHEILKLNLLKLLNNRAPT